MESKRISWPGWEVVRLIGRGSFGTVYEIQRDVLGNTEKAALKVISIPQNASDIDEMYSNGYDEESITNTFKFHLKSIVEEYSMMRKLSDCPNIVSCDDVRYIQHDDGIGWDIYIKMELLTPLLKSIQNQVSEDTIVKLAKDICSALVSCKQYNIVHRDIKPQNIFLSSSGIYKLGDFGIAKTVEKTMGGTKVGTYNYMAPEVYNNKPYGSAADIYSLGLVLYWLLNERRMPFLPLPPVKLSVGMDETARNRRLSGESFAEPKNGSKQLKAIVMKACDYNLEDRYSSASEMLMDLNQLGQKHSELREVTAVIPSSAATFSNAVVLEEEEDKTIGIFGMEASDNTVIAAAQLQEGTIGLFPKPVTELAHTDSVASASDFTEEKMEATNVQGELVAQDISLEDEKTEEKTGKESTGNAKKALCTNVSVSRRIPNTVVVGIALVLLFTIGAVLLFGKEKDGEKEQETISDTAVEQETVDFYLEAKTRCLDLAVAGDFAGAVEYLNDCIADSNDSRLRDLLSFYEAKLAEENALLAKQAILDDAAKLAEDGQFRLAIHMLDQAWRDENDVDYYEAAVQYRTEFGIYNNSQIAAGKYNSILLYSDGSTLVVGDKTNDELDANYWTDVAEVCMGDRHVLGLRTNGTVIAAGETRYGQCDVSAWRNVVSISAGDVHSVGLLEDGTVVATGYNDHGQRNVSKLMAHAGNQRIVAVSAGHRQTLALLENGRVVACGDNATNACDVYDWRDIAAIYTGTDFSAGLREDGTVVVTKSSWNVSGWRDVVTLAAGDFFLVGLLSDGTVVAVGDKGMLNVSNWRDIVAIAAGHDHAVAVDENGNVWSTGSNDHGQYFSTETSLW